MLKTVPRPTFDTAFDYETTLVLAIELSTKSWVLAAQVTLKLAGNSCESSYEAHQLGWVLQANPQLYERLPLFHQLMIADVIAISS